MERAGIHGDLFRLVVRLDQREVVVGRPPFRSRKAATARVADAVRLAAGTGAVRCVALEESGPPTNGGPAPSWTEVERWGPNVVQRILAQATDRIAPARAPVPIPAPAPALCVVPRLPAAHTRRPGHRRHVAVAVGLAAVAWIATTLMMGGSLLGGSTSTIGKRPSGIATELPFTATHERKRADRRAGDADIPLVELATQKVR